MRKLWLPTLFIIVILSVAILTFYWSYGYTSPIESNTPKAKKGIIDLSGFDFNKNKNIKLIGECEFYWNQLLEPNDFLRSDGTVCKNFFRLPGVWTGCDLNGEKIPSFGYATFRLFIKVDSIQSYGLKIKEFDCSYRLWVDGQLAAEVGIVSSDPSLAKPSWKRKEYYFTNTSDTIELVFQVANFIHRKGGPEDVIYFGKESKIKQYKYMQTTTSLFLTGVLFIMAFYHFILYLFRPRDKSVLYFSLFSFLVLLRLVTTGEKLLIEFLPDLNFLAAVRLEYISYTIAVPVCFSFFNCFITRKAPRWLMKGIYSICAINVIIVLFFPIQVFSYTPLGYQFLVMLLSIYIFIWLAVDMYKRISQTYILFGGYFFFMILVINDILYYNQLINTSQLLPLGLFILIFSQAFVLSRISSVTFAQVEKLSTELDIKNKELEIKVIERTREILNKKDEIEKQKAILENQAENLLVANQQLHELNQFKEGVTGMLVHDLKNPLNVILNLSKDNLVKYAGNQMLNLIHNLQDIQKYENSTMQINQSFQVINSLIDSADEQVAYLRLKKNIEFRNQIDKVISFGFDPNIIERVFINLFTNAIKYSPEDSEIILNIEIENNRIKFLIFDQGIGIPENKRDVIFSKYGQIVARKSGQANSLGLGLAFCKMAVEAHSGSIGFHANQPKGSVFWFELPFIQGTIADKIDIEMAKPAEFIQFIEQVLTPNDKLYLRKFIANIQRFQIYEISDINQELKKIDNNYSRAVFVWKQALYDAANTINQSRYEMLIQMIQ